MRLCLVAALSLVASICAAGENPAHAAAERMAKSCPEIYRATLYTSQITGMPMLRDCVEVLFYPPGSSHGRPMDPRTLSTQGTTYYPATDTVVLPASVDLSTARGFSMLLHELVHAQQFAFGRDGDVACHAELELEAFTVQAQFLDDMGDTEAAEVYRRKMRHAGDCSYARTVLR